MADIKQLSFQSPSTVAAARQCLVVSAALSWAEVNNGPRWMSPGELEVTYQCRRQLGRTPPASDSHQLPGAARGPTHNVKVIHQAQSDKGFQGGAGIEMSRS